MLLEINLARYRSLLLFSLLGELSLRAYDFKSIMIWVPSRVASVKGGLDQRQFTWASMDAYYECPS